MLTHAHDALFTRRLAHSKVGTLLEASIWHKQRNTHRRDGGAFKTQGEEFTQALELEFAAALASLEVGPVPIQRRRPALKYSRACLLTFDSVEVVSCNAVQEEAMGVYSITMERHRLEAALAADAPHDVGVF